MKISRFFSALLTLIVFASLFGTQGQYTTVPSQTRSSIASTTSMNSQYTQFYTIPPGPAPSVHVSVPVQFDITSRTPGNLYFSTQNQVVPYSQYISNPANMRVNSLWIQGATDWTQYAVVPQGAATSILAVSSTGGNGYLNEIRPDGTVYNTNFYFYPYSLFTFYADTIGRHVLSFGINGQMSNTVVIDVIGNYVPPNNYLPQPMSYYPTNYYPYGYYPYGYDPFDYNNNVSPIYHRSRWWL